MFFYLFMYIQDSSGILLLVLGVVGYRDFVVELDFSEVVTCNMFPFDREPCQQ